MSGPEKPGEPFVLIPRSRPERWLDEVTALRGVLKKG
jgi:hypothetical protein